MFKKGNETWKKAHPVTEKTKKKLRISAQIRWAKVRLQKKLIEEE